MTKKQLLIIVGFLYCVSFVLFVTFSFFSHKNSIAQASRDEILTDRYVETNILAESGEFEATSQEYVFNNQTFKLPVDELRELSMKKPPTQILGATSDPKKIIVDLAHQRVYAYEGDRLVINFLVSTGKWGATPPGDYSIWYKVRSQTMKGGNRELGTYYYLPNVQWIQYFNKGIGFHSTYWHNNFGHPMSHGCVNMTITDAETLYYWANPTVSQGMKIFRSNSDNPGTPVKVVESWSI